MLSFLKQSPKSHDKNQEVLLMASIENSNCVGIILERGNLRYVSDLGDKFMVSHQLSADYDTVFQNWWA